MLALAGLVDSWWFTQESRDRGHTVHCIGEQALRNEPITVAPTYSGYAVAVKAAVSTLKIRPICIERRLLYHDINGRPDVIGWIPEPVGRIPAGPIIGDFKSGDPAPTHSIQLGFYEILADLTPDLRAELPSKFQNLPWQRVGMYVKPTGRFKLKHYTDPNDKRIAAAIVDLVRWRAANKLLGESAAQSYSYADDDPSFPLESASGL